MGKTDTRKENWDAGELCSAAESLGVGSESGLGPGHFYTTALVFLSSMFSGLCCVPEVCALRYVQGSRGFPPLGKAGLLRFVLHVRSLRTVLFEE